VFEVLPDNLVAGLAAVGTMAALAIAYGFLLLGRNPGRASLDPAERVGLWLVAGYIALSWLGAVLAVASVFVWWVILLGAALLVLVARRLWPHAQTRRSKPLAIPYTVLAAVLLTGAAVLFAKPAETYLLFDDSAVYTLSGIHLAHHGTLYPAITSPVCSGNDLIRFWGPFFPWGGCGPTMSVGFMPVTKVWAAYFTWLLGPGGTVFAATFGAVVGMSALLLFLRKALGPLTALVSGSLTTVSFPVVWFSRMLMSEFPTMAALFGALWLLAVERESSTENDRPSVLGVAAALGLSLLCLIRFEALLLLVILLAAWLLNTQQARLLDPGRLIRSWSGRWLVWVLVLTIVAMPLAVLSSPHYYLDVFSKVLGRSGIRLFLLGIIAVGALYAAIGGWPAARRAWDRLCGRGLDRVILAAAGGMLLLLSLVTLAVPTSSETESVLWMVAYLGSPLTLLGLAGLVLLALRRPPAEMYAVLALTIGLALLYEAKSFVNPVHPWAMRRFVPFIIPILLTAAVWLLEMGWRGWSQRLASRRWLPTLLALPVIVALAWAAIPMVRVTLPYVTYQETAGLWQQLAALNETYPENALLVFDDGPLGTRIPQVMSLVFDHDVQSLLEGPGSTRMGDFAKLLGARDRRTSPAPTIFSVIDGEVSWDLPYKLVPVGTMSIGAPRVMTESAPPPGPEDIGYLTFTVNQFAFEPLSEAEATGRLVELPALGVDVRYLEGFGDVDYDNGRAYRWMESEARLVVPVPQDLASGSSARVTLQLGAWRPGEAPAADAVLYAPGIDSVPLALESSFVPQEIQIEIPNVEQLRLDTLSITLAATPWVPLEYGIPDGRALGLIYFGGTVEFVE
jgi:hypothetical protein